MLGALRRKVTTGGSSASVLGKSLQVIRQSVSASRVSSNVGKEIMFLQPRGIVHVRNFSHLVLLGSSAGLTKTRDVISSIQSETIMQKCKASLLAMQFIWIRPLATKYYQAHLAVSNRAGLPRDGFLSCKVELAMKVVPILKQHFLSQEQCGKWP
ncbi:uncharacterized protein LOC120188003 [Hibiscus syriacus]|uniref:uncharacterized protein LOC120188003 n=1 Tax=Hibiscus syriacus TaxID=106335 RepID=UPI001923B8D3|nr:uncharacterized protein LOC120188003 [Hibiscus syriacus]